MTCQRFATIWALALSATAWATDKPAPDIVRSPGAEEALKNKFSVEDDKLLDEVERGCFLYFWKEVGSPACLVKDRMLAPVSSIAAVGFQLSSLPVGIERGWITKAEGEARARTILDALLGRNDNRRFGVFLHYPDMHTAGASHEGFEYLCSTVDHALFLAGALVAGQYFGGDIAERVDRIAAETNWKAFTNTPEGFLSMGWKPAKLDDIAGNGKLIDLKWDMASDEERLIYFLAAGASNPEFGVDPAIYYKLKRFVRQHKDMPPFVVSWPGPLFTYFFSHCWIDYSKMGADNPMAFGVGAPRVDWFENSRRATLTHRQRCIEQSDTLHTLSADRWGLSACSTCEDGYIVPMVKPNLADKDNFEGGTIAPYAAGSAIMFTPQESMIALRAFRELKRPDSKPFAWREPSEGGYGFVDSFNLDKKKACEDYVGIDQGPMLLAIENARTGLIWRIFMDHPLAKRAVERLKLAR
jgi:hypothetical protein